MTLTVLNNQGNDAEISWKWLTSTVLAQYLIFSEGKQIDVLHLVRGPMGYITCPWQAPKPGFLPRSLECQTNTSHVSYFITWPLELWNLNTYILTKNNIWSGLDLPNIPLSLCHLLCCQIWAWASITAYKTSREDSDGGCWILKCISYWVSLQDKQ